MKKPQLRLLIVIGAVLIAALFLFSDRPEAGKQNGAGQNYKDFAYKIDGKEVFLKDETKYFGNEANGDLNGDSVPDVAFLITREPGGSGTFFYVVVALKTNDGYIGSNAVLIGDRIAPQNTELQNGVLIVNYADRAPGEPMTTRPSVGKSMYLIFENNELKEIKPLTQGEQVLFGSLVFGHEVRSFTPCGVGQTEYWLMGDSPALAEIKATYEKESAGSPPYIPIFAVIAGKIVPAPDDGFGADYELAIRVSQLIRDSKTDNCP